MFNSGLENLGNSCYLNSILQSLRGCPDFIDLIWQHRHVNELINTLAKILRLMNLKSVTIRPSLLIKTITSDHDNEFQMNAPADAHEVLVYVLDKIHKSISTKINTSLPRSDNELVTKADNAFRKMHETEYSMMLPIFYGQFLSLVKAKNASDTYCSETFDTFSTIHVPIPDRREAINLYDCLDEHFKPEVLSGANSIFDDVQNRYVIATKKVYLSRYPKILVIALNRFGRISSPCGKNLRDVQIPVFLNIAKYTMEKSSIRYELRSVCNHIGNDQYGHYFCCQRESASSWCLYDDATMKNTTYERSTDPSAYILFYHRISV